MLAAAQEPGAQRAIWRALQEVQKKEKNSKKGIDKSDGIVYYISCRREEVRRRDDGNRNAVNMGA